MATRERSGDRGRRQVTRDRGEALRDLRQRRLTLGLSQASIAAATGVSRSLVGRIERDELGSPDLGDIGAIAAALGLRLRIGIYPDGQPIADGVQLRLLTHLGRQLHPGLRWRMEVPLPINGDLRAWDAVVGSDDDRAGIEGISRLGAVDATVRRVLQKQRDDARIRSVVLVVADTVRNRDAIATAGNLLRDSFPLDSVAVMRDLRLGRIPRLNGIVLLRVPRAG
jgi:transcriptional regulator with XRE-family HTH domain